MLLSNVGNDLPRYTVSHPRRLKMWCQYFCKIQIYRNKYGSQFLDKSEYEKREVRVDKNPIHFTVCLPVLLLLVPSPELDSNCCHPTEASASKSILSSVTRHPLLPKYVLFLRVSFWLWALFC
jgi:hypothetical protein